MSSIGDLKKNMQEKIKSLKRRKGSDGLRNGLNAHVADLNSRARFLQEIAIVISRGPAALRCPDQTSLKWPLALPFGSECSKLWLWRQGFALKTRTVYSFAATVISNCKLYEVLSGFEC